MARSDRLDLTNLPRFLDHLEQRDSGSAALARALLKTGWDVRSFRGPEQMDVWSLELVREGRSVVFGIERGIADGVQVGRPGGGPTDFSPLSRAILAWARVHGVDLPLDDPEDFRPDPGAYGMQTVEWVLSGDDGAVDRVTAAWQEYLLRRYSRDQLLGDEWLAATKGWGLQLIEAAARGDDSSGTSAEPDAV